MNNAGSDRSDRFHEVSHDTNAAALELMKEYYIGDLFDNERDIIRQAGLSKVVLSTFFAFGIYIISNASKKHWYKFLCHII